VFGAWAVKIGRNEEVKKRSKCQCRKGVHVGPSLISTRHGFWRRVASEPAERNEVGRFGSGADLNTR
jgi:hypothetical protein